MLVSTWCCVFVPAVHSTVDQVLSPQLPVGCGAQKTPPVTVVGERSWVVVYPTIE
jgi:hypothetical protein